jgi:hypothetical protein
VRNINGPQPASEVSERQRLAFWPRLLAAGEPAARTGSPAIRRALRATPVPSLAPFVAEATRVIAPKFLMVPLLAQKAGLDDKVKVFVLYVEPITDMIDRSLKADAH